MASRIERIIATKVLDSEMGVAPRVDIFTSDGRVFTGSAPQGTSAGSFEAVAIPCDDAIAGLEKIIPEIITFNPSDLKQLDDYLDRIGGENMRTIGSNASTPLSSAWAQMAAAYHGVPLYQFFARSLGQPSLPVPSFNIINGGLHGATDENGKPYNPIQETMLMPVTARTFQEACLMCGKVYKKLGELLGTYGNLVGKEGGYSPPKPLEWSIDKIALAVKEVGYKTTDFALVFDSAANDFFDRQSGLYRPVAGGDLLDVDGIVEFYQRLMEKSPIPVHIFEDPLAEHDFEGFAKLTQALKGRTHTMGDDLYVTQISRLERGINNSSTDMILIKRNQRGTTTGTLEVMRYAAENGLLSMVSHRSKRVPGDLTDMHLATAMGHYMKHGSARGERVEMYNEGIFLERNYHLPYAGLFMFNRAA